MSEVTATPAVLDLASPRTFVLIGHANYTLTCRRVTPEDWAAYYAALTVASQQDGKDVINSIDLDTPRRVLAERVIVAAAGYTVANGAAIESLPSWQKHLPLAHRLKIGQMLANVTPGEGNDETIYPEGEQVFLDAMWGSALAKADDANPDPGPIEWVNPNFFTGLNHVLAVPSEEQHRRFSRESSRTRVMGGSRTGTTLYPGVQTLLATLYDELIVSVDGYVVNGEPLAGRETIAREMDTHHKVVAALQIFQPRTQRFVDGGV